VKTPVARRLDFSTDDGTIDDVEAEFSAKRTDADDDRAWSEDDRSWLESESDCDMGCDTSDLPLSSRLSSSSSSSSS
jgi:hypothetical protein